MMIREDDPFRGEVIRLACTYGWYGYRTIVAMMRNAGWQRVTQQSRKRIWQHEGLMVPDKQAPRWRLWLKVVACLRLRSQYPNQVWSDDYVFIRGAYGRKIRMLNMIDDYMRVYLVIHCAMRIVAQQVIEQLADAMLVYGIPQHIRSDNGYKFVAKVLRDWLKDIGVQTA